MVKYDYKPFTLDAPMEQFKNERIYIASPYSHSVRSIRHERYRCALDATIKLTKAGLVCFSPIVHSHQVAEIGQINGGFDFWGKWCKSFLDEWATEFWILTLQEHEISKGLNAELNYITALKREITVRFVDWAA